jgi:rhamnogalacturonyl hydrolase YesR
VTVLSDLLSAQQPTDDVVQQFTLIEKHTRDSSSGLLRHGYDYSKKASWADPVTGASPEVWDRALGWYSMALVDVLQYIPEHHPGYRTIMGYYKQLMKALKKSADRCTGAWWLVMSQPGRDSTSPLSDHPLSASIVRSKPALC